MKKLVLSALLVLVAFGLPHSSFAYTNPGKASGFVNDFANLLSTNEINELETKLRAFEADTTNEIALVTINSLAGDTIENFAVKLFEDWKIGKEGKDNGILLLVAKEERKVRIEVGYGLEGAITDALSNRIIQKEIVPQFKNSNYYAGISQGIDSIIEASKGEYSATAPSEFSPLFESLGNNFIYIFLALIFLLQWLASILGRSKSWWFGGVLGVLVAFGVAFFFSFSTMLTLLIAFVLGIIGLIFDFIVSHTFISSQSRGMRPPWWIGGTKLGGGSHGGGFGGFGGGRSGGGGASGGW